MKAAADAAAAASGPKLVRLADSDSEESASAKDATDRSMNETSGTNITKSPNSTDDGEDDDDYDQDRTRWLSGPAPPTLQWQTCVDVRARFLTKCPTTGTPSGTSSCEYP